MRDILGSGAESKGGLEEEKLSRSRASVCVCDKWLLSALPMRGAQEARMFPTRCPLFGPV